MITLGSGSSRPWDLPRKCRKSNWRISNASIGLRTKTTRIERSPIAMPRGRCGLSAAFQLLWPSLLAAASLAFVAPSGKGEYITATVNPAGIVITVNPPCRISTCATFEAWVFGRPQHQIQTRRCRVQLHHRHWCDKIRGPTGLVYTGDTHLCCLLLNMCNDVPQHACVV